MGPYLYDLLPAPATITGECTAVPKVEEWYQQETEELILEIPSMLDEDKVVCALWSRFMVVHRCVSELATHAL